MRVFKKCLFCALVVAFAASDALASQVCQYYSNRTVEICGPPSVGVVNANCPSGQGLAWCGLEYNPGSNWAGPHGNGFHDYVTNTSGHYSQSPGFDSQYWLNNWSLANGGPTFQLCNSLTWSNSVSCYGQLVNKTNLMGPNSSPPYYRAPYGTPARGSSGPYDLSCNPSATSGACDQGYYPVVTDPNKPIIIQFGTVSGNNTTGYQCTGCISEFSVFWGSVDSWNTIVFIDASGQVSQITAGNCASQPGCLSFTGTQVAGSGVNRQNNVASYIEDFKDGSGQLAWQTVEFYSSSPAFEFDNIAWVTNACAYVNNCPGPGTNTSGPPVPEPSSFVLLCTGALGVAGALKRRFFR